MKVCIIASTSLTAVRKDMGLYMQIISVLMILRYRGFRDLEDVHTFPNFSKVSLIYRLEKKLVINGTT